MHLFLAEFALGPFAIEHPESIIAAVLGAIIVAAMLWFLNIPALSRSHFKSALTERHTRIADNEAQIDQALSDIRKLRDDYSTRLHRIEDEARERIAAAERDAEVSHAEIIEEAQRSALALRRRAEEELARERTRSRILLQREIVATALDAAEQAIRTSGSEGGQHALIQGFITSVAVGSGSGASSDLRGA